MRISAINVRQGINKGFRKVKQGANYVADEAKQVVNKMPAKARKIAFPALIGISAFFAGVAMPNKANAQPKPTSSITYQDNRESEIANTKLFNNWYQSECDEGTFNVRRYSQDGTLVSAYRELAKYTIKEVDKDNDGKMNYGEYVEHVKLDFEARKLLENKPYPADKEKLATCPAVKNEFDCFDGNGDGYIDRDEFAGVIAGRDVADSPKDNIFDGKISVCSANQLGLASDKNGRFYYSYKSMLQIFTQHIKATSREEVDPKEEYKTELVDKTFNRLHDPEVCKDENWNKY